MHVPSLGSRLSSTSSSLHERNVEPKVSARLVTDRLATAGLARSLGSLSLSLSPSLPVHIIPTTITARSTRDSGNRHHERAHKLATTTVLRSYGLVAIAQAGALRQ